MMQMIFQIKKISELPPPPSLPQFQSKQFINSLNVAPKIQIPINYDMFAKASISNKCLNCNGH